MLKNNDGHGIQRCIRTKNRVNDITEQVFFSNLKLFNRIVGIRKIPQDCIKSSVCGNLSFFPWTIQYYILSNTTNTSISERKRFYVCWVAVSIKKQFLQSSHSHCLVMLLTRGGVYVSILYIRIRIYIDNKSK